MVDYCQKWLTFVHFWRQLNEYLHHSWQNALSKNQLLGQPFNQLTFNHIHYTSVSVYHSDFVHYFHYLFLIQKSLLKHLVRKHTQIQLFLFLYYALYLFHSFLQVFLRLFISWRILTLENKKSVQFLLFYWLSVKYLFHTTFKNILSALKNLFKLKLYFWNLKLFWIWVSLKILFVCK